MNLQKKFLFSVVMLFIVVHLVIAQESCEVIVQQAIETASENCNGLRRNQACYGNVTIDAEAAPDVDDFTFDDSGDIVNLSDLSSLRLSSFSAEDNEWGIAQLSVQANLPDDSSENAQILLFGDVQVENIGSEATTPIIEITITATGNLNVRGGPSTSNAIVASLSAGESVTASGRNAAGDWIQINLPNDAGTGWVYTPLVQVDDDVNTLAIVEGDSLPMPQYGPMQAFYFRNENTDSDCETVTENGMMIQTPQGAGELTFLINEVQIELGSTIYIQAIPSANMTVDVLEGQAVVTAGDESVTAPAGVRVVIPLDENGIAAGIPSHDDYERNETLPIILLNDVISIAEPNVQTIVWSGTQGIVVSPDVAPGDIDICNDGPLILYTEFTYNAGGWGSFTASAGTTVNIELQNLGGEFGPFAFGPEYRHTITIFEPDIVENVFTDPALLRSGSATTASYTFETDTRFTIWTGSGNTDGDGQMVVSCG